MGLSTVLLGEAPPQFNPNPVSIKGDINAPLSFAITRSNQISILDTHVLLHHGNLSVTLVINEHEQCNRTTVTGELKEDEMWKELKFNGNKAYTRDALIDLFKFNGKYFIEPKFHRELMLKLMQFNSEVVLKESGNKDTIVGKGDKSSSYQVTDVLSGYNFQLQVPLFKGHKSAFFTVEIHIEVKSGSVVFYLVCNDFEQIKEEAVTSIFSAQDAAFTGLGYAVIHQY